MYIKRTPRGCHPCTKEQIQKHYALKLSSMIQYTKPKKIQVFVTIKPDTQTIQQLQEVEHIILK